MTDTEDQRRHWLDAAAAAEARNLQIFTAAISWATFSLKTALTINGGAALALLAFFGSMISANDAGKSYYIARISPALLCFCFGVSSAALAGGLAYFADSLAFHGAPHPWHNYEQLHLRTPAPDTPMMDRFARYLTYAAIVAWTISFVLFTMGTVIAYYGFQDGR
jgi:hypothetical protein